MVCAGTLDTFQIYVWAVRTGHLLNVQPTRAPQPKIHKPHPKAPECQLRTTSVACLSLTSGIWMQVVCAGTLDTFQIYVWAVRTGRLLGSLLTLLSYQHRPNPKDKNPPSSATPC